MAAKKVFSNLPAPEVDITKTTYFMNFPSSGGPFYDAALHNQAATIKLLQTVRQDLATVMPFDEVTQKHSWKYTEDVNQIMANANHVKILVEIAQNWQESDENHGMVLSNSDRLQEMANSLYQAICTSFDDADWDMSDLIVDDSERQLITLLKKVGDQDGHKRDLELAIAHWMKDNNLEVLGPPVRGKTQTPLVKDTSPVGSGPGTPRAASPRSSVRRLRSDSDRSAVSSSRTDPIHARRSAGSGSQFITGSRTGRTRLSRGGDTDLGNRQAPSRASTRSQARSSGSANTHPIDLTASSDHGSDSTMVRHRARAVDPTSVDATGNAQPMGSGSVDNGDDA